MCNASPDKVRQTFCKTAVTSHSNHKLKFWSRFSDAEIWCRSTEVIQSKTEKLLTHREYRSSSSCNAHITVVLIRYEYTSYKAKPSSYRTENRKYCPQVLQYIYDFVYDTKNNIYFIFYNIHFKETNYCFKWSRQILNSLEEKIGVKN